MWTSKIKLCVTCYNVKLFRPACLFSRSNFFNFILKRSKLLVTPLCCDTHGCCTKCFLFSFQLFFKIFPEMVDRQHSRNVMLTVLTARSCDRFSSCEKSMNDEGDNNTLMRGALFLYKLCSPKCRYYSDRWRRPLDFEKCLFCL